MLSHVPFPKMFSIVISYIEALKGACVEKLVNNMNGNEVCVFRKYFWIFISQVWIMNFFKHYGYRIYINEHRNIIMSTWCQTCWSGIHIVPNLEFQTVQTLSRGLQVSFDLSLTVYVPLEGLKICKAFISKRVLASGQWINVIGVRAYFMQK